GGARRREPVHARLPDWRMAVLLPDRRERAPAVQRHSRRARPGMAGPSGGGEVRGPLRGSGEMLRMAYAAHPGSFIGVIAIQLSQAVLAPAGAWLFASLID